MLMVGILIEAFQILLQLSRIVLPEWWGMASTLCPVYSTAPGLMYRHVSCIRRSDALKAFQHGVDHDRIRLGPAHQKMDLLPPGIRTLFRIFSLALSQ